MKLLNNTVFAVAALWLSACGATGLNMEPEVVTKVVIGNSAHSPADQPPLVVNASGVLVRSQIPGAPPVVEEEAPPTTFEGTE